MPPPGSPFGFYQTGKGRPLTIRVIDWWGHWVQIIGMDSIDPSAPSEYPDWPEYWMEEYTLIATVPGDHVITAVCVMGGEVRQTYRVSQVISVQWEAFYSPLASQPAGTPGGGLRIFPDWPLADYNPFRADKYALVYIHATVDPLPSDPQQPLYIHFRAFDVDDPSANTGPVDVEQDRLQPNVDNRGIGSFVLEEGIGWAGGWKKCPTNGHVRATVIVAGYPGDNYRGIADTADDPWVNYYPLPNDGTTARIASRNTTDPNNPILAPPALYTQQMLTVWRRLHVECDTMADVEESANIVGATVQSASGGVADMDWEFGEILTVEDRFDPGIMMETYHHSTYYITANTVPDYGAPMEIFTVNYEGGTPFQNDEMSLYDDDWDWSSNTPPETRHLLPQWPNLSISQQVYRKAYIEVDDEPGEEGGRWNSTVDFYSYRDYATQHKDRGTTGLGDDWYWVGYVLNAFQLSQEMSGDPDYLAVRGAFPPPTPDTGGCLVYVEAHRDHNALIGSPEPLGIVAAHELAHSLPSVGGGHPEIQRSIIEKISATQFKVNGPPTQAGYNITAGSHVRILVPGQPWWKAETSVGWMQSWQQVADGYIITLEAALIYLENGPRGQVQWNYEVGDTAQFWSKCVMGQSRTVEDFCPVWLDRIRKNTDSPLEK